jgi:hypothetical protein
MEEQSFPDYLESLEANTSPAAAAEISRYRRGEE